MPGMVQTKILLNQRNIFSDMRPMEETWISKLNSDLEILPAHRVHPSVRGGPYTQPSPCRLEALARALTEPEGSAGPSRSPKRDYGAVCCTASRSGQRI